MLTNTNTITTSTEVVTRTLRLRSNSENENIRDLREQATVEIRNEQYNIPRLPTDENNTGDREADFLNLLETDVGTEGFRRNLLEAIANRQTDTGMFRELIGYMDTETTQWLLNIISQPVQGPENFGRILNILRIGFALGMTDTVMVTQEIFAAVSEQTDDNLMEFTERTNEIRSERLENAAEANEEAQNSAEAADNRGRRDRALALNRHRFRLSMAGAFTSLLAAGDMYLGINPQNVIPMVQDTVLGTIGVRTGDTVRPTAPNTSNNSLLGSIFQTLADYFNNK